MPPPSSLARLAWMTLASMLTGPLPWTRLGRVGRQLAGDHHAAALVVGLALNQIRLLRDVAAERRAAAVWPGSRRREIAAAVLGGEVAADARCGRSGSRRCR